MQREVHLAFRTGVGDEFILARMTGVLEAAPRHPFVEPFNPAETAAALEVDEFRMHHLLDRRIPAQPHIAKVYIEDAHAARGDHSKAQSAVVHLDNLHPLLFAALQDTLANVALGLAAVSGQIAGDHLPTAHAIPLGRIRESFLEWGRLGYHRQQQ